MWHFYVSGEIGAWLVQGSVLQSIDERVGIDAINVLALETFLNVATTGAISVCPYVPRGPNATVGVKSEVDANISEEDLIKHV